MISAVDQRRPDVYGPAVTTEANRPGRVRDAILDVLAQSGSPLSVAAIISAVEQSIGPTPRSSIRSYLRLNTPLLFVREERGVYKLRQSESARRPKPGDADEHDSQVTFKHQRATLICGDCFDWLRSRKANSIHAVVTDPPYGLHEYAEDQQAKLRTGKGGVWRIPPAYDGHQRSPLPRFTTLMPAQLQELGGFFLGWFHGLFSRASFPAPTSSSLRIHWFLIWSPTHSRQLASNGVARSFV